MITKPRGTVDWYGKKMREFTALKLIIRNLMDLYNFEEIETPVFENYELFSRSVGEETDIVSKEMFTFEDRKARKMALRPEGTASAARMILEDKLYIPENLPLKCFYLEPMFRYERPQNGRQRQFNQFGVEVFGSDEFITDVEVIAMAVDVLHQLGLKNLKCHINYLVSGANRKKYISDLKGALKGKPLCDDCKTRFEKNPLRVLDCKIDGNQFGDLITMEDYLDPEDKAKFEHIISSLEQINIEVVKDKLLVRGLDYYTGTVFEIKSTSSILGAQSTMIGGGRYNNLVEQLGGVPLPAIGFGLGIERVLIALSDEDIQLTNEKTLDAFILPIGEKATKASVMIASILRAANITCELNHLNKNVKSAFKLVERLHAKNVIIFGDEELKRNVVKIKNQNDKKEIEVPFNELISYFEK